MKDLNKIALLALFGLFFFINIKTLNDGHNWGDDFAQYIQHAINLVEHKPYSSDISYDLFVTYPPGFPFLLSTLIFWFGVSFKVLKSLNIVFWALSALVVHSLVHRRLGLFWAGLVTTWYLTSPFFFFFKQNVLSDVPFACFVLLSIVSCIKSEEYQQKGAIDSSRVYLWASIFCMSFSLLIRWAGASLLLAFILYFLVVKRDWKRPLGFMLGAAMSCFIAFKCGCTLGGYFDRTTVSLLQHWSIVSFNSLTYTFQIILGFYLANDALISKLSIPSIFGAINIVSGFLVLGFTGLFLFRLFQRKISVLGCFTYLYLIGAIIWPVHEGTRYILPVMAPVTIFLIEWTKPPWRKLAGIIFLLLILQNIFVIAFNFKFNDDDIYQKRSIDMMQWVEGHIKPGDQYMFSHPRALGLLTHRIGHTFGEYQKYSKDWYERIEPLRIKYLIADRRFDLFSQYDHFRIKSGRVELSINKVWGNGLYKIYDVVLPAKSSLTPVQIGH